MEAKDKILEELMRNTEAGVTTYSDVNHMLDDLRKTMIQKLIDKEFENHMGYEKGSHSEKNNNRRNGKGITKKLKTNNGEFEVTTPRDREGTFEPIIVPKRKKIITEIADQITLLYAKGNSIRDIKDILESIYGTKINEEFISDATKIVNEEVKIWKERPLSEIYVIIYMDCLYVNVRENGISQKKAIYVALGINIEGKKEILGFWYGDTESSSFWYNILEEIKTRGVKDILFLCSDGVAGFKEILEQSYPKTKHQRCIVHIIRNMVPCVLRKEQKDLCDNLKLIYKANNKDEALAAVDSFREKYKNNRILMRKLESNIDSLIDLYDYSFHIRKMIYTTNPIESVNSCLRKVTNGKGSFVNMEALTKVLYLRIKELSKKWNRSTKANWSNILNELSESFNERVDKYIEI